MFLNLLQKKSLAPEQSSWIWKICTTGVKLLIRCQESKACLVFITIIASRGIEKHRVKEAFVYYCLVPCFVVDQTKMWVATASLVEIPYEVRIVTFRSILLKTYRVTLLHLEGVETTAPYFARYFKDISLYNQRIILDLWAGFQAQDLLLEMPYAIWC